MDSDVSEIPPYRGHNPIPLKKRYINWNQILANAAPSRTQMAAGHCNQVLPHHSHQKPQTGMPSNEGTPSDFKTLDSLQMRSLQLLNSPCPSESAQHESLLLALSHDQDPSRTLKSSDMVEKSFQMAYNPHPPAQRLQQHESSRLSAAQTQDVSRATLVRTTGKGRSGKHRRHVEGEEARRKHAREWILKNDSALLAEPQEDSKDEIYIQINGRQYIARPVEKDAKVSHRGRSKKDKWHGSPVTHQQNSGHSSSYVPAVRPNGNFALKKRELSASSVAVPNPCIRDIVSYEAEKMRHQLSKEVPEYESLEQMILKDKMAMLSQIRQTAKGNLATVPLEFKDHSLEACREDLEPTESQSLVLDQLDCLRSPSVESQCSPPLTSPYIVPQRHSLPSVSALIPRQMNSPGYRYSSPQSQRLAPSPSIGCPSPAPSTLSLPLSPGSVASSSESMAENFASTRFGTSPDSTNNIQEGAGASSPPSLLSGGSVDRGSEFTASEAMETGDMTMIQSSMPAIKVEPDMDCSESPRVKRPADNKCPVCGDEVSGYHYGIYSCESCKGFFKRTVQNKRNERLRCARDGNCEMNLRSRKHCAYCRFEKCVDQGMKLEAIRGDRQRGGRSMYEGSSEYRRRLMLQIQQQKGEPSQSATKRKRRRLDSTAAARPKETWETQVAIKKEPSPEPHPTVDEGALQHIPQLINELIAHNAFLLAQPLASCCQLSGFSEECIFRDICHLVNHHLVFMFEWAQGLPYFRELEKEDQQFLYKHRWIPLMLTHYCLSISNDPAFVKLRDGRIIDLEQCFESANFIDFVKSLKDIVGFFVELNLDPVECAVLRLLVLLNSDAPINQPSRVNHFQEKVQDTLIHYVLSKDPTNARRVGDILLRFAEIEKLCHLLHEQFTFRYLGGQLSEFSLLCEILKTN